VKKGGGLGRWFLAFMTSRTYFFVLNEHIARKDHTGNLSPSKEYMVNEGCLSLFTLL